MLNIEKLAFKLTSRIGELFLYQPFFSMIISCLKWRWSCTFWRCYENNLISICEAFICKKAKSHLEKFIIPFFFFFPRDGFE